MEKIQVQFVLNKMTNRYQNVDNHCFSSLQYLVEA